MVELRRELAVLDLHDARGQRRRRALLHAGERARLLQARDDGGEVRRGRVVEVRAGRRGKVEVDDVPALRHAADAGRELDAHVVALLDARRVEAASRVGVASVPLLLLDHRLDVLLLVVLGRDALAGRDVAVVLVVALALRDDLLRGDVLALARGRVGARAAVLQHVLVVARARAVVLDDHVDVALELLHQLGQRRAAARRQGRERRRLRGLAERHLAAEDLDALFLDLEDGQLDCVHVVELLEEVVVGLEQVRRDEVDEAARLRVERLHQRVQLRGRRAVRRLLALAQGGDLGHDAFQRLPALLDLLALAAVGGQAPRRRRALALRHERLLERHDWDDPTTEEAERALRAGR
mmetsp:Transcript_27533/g.91125  ORF Transcript_27533/g.91125 Transcript_27533/m.91125 type:complete len:353 (-) Transcript_27533:198-1256(-)